MLNKAKKQVFPIFIILSMLERNLIRIMVSSPLVTTHGNKSRKYERKQAQKNQQ